MKAPTTRLSPLRLANVIALTGCDGAGKSTLSEDLAAAFEALGPVEWLYLGQSSGNIARWIQDLPLVGPPLGRYLVSKAKSSQSKNKTAPGVATTLVIYLLSQWRAHKFRRMLKLNRRGVIVITDRYPQAEVPGFHFDGPGLGAVTLESGFSRALARREQRLYEWMASHVPALVIRLNIDADTAHQRKPDHRISVLRDKVEIIPGLQFNGAQILDLSGSDPYPQVLESATNAARAACEND
ncbi:MAG: hypothetical protein ABJ322_18275 [Marinobacter sp.]|uniref:hypothetical protein n=1 Tax=Marinobacter sp. TaxID=50741 RepID=UPI0032997534